MNNIYLQTLLTNKTKCDFRATLWLNFDFQVLARNIKKNAILVVYAKS